MIDFFDSLGNTLNDIIGSHSNNSVKWAGSQILNFAEGGVVNEPPSTPGLLQSAFQAAKQTMNSGKQDTSYLGGSFLNSPTYLMQHYSQLGKFFHGGEAGNAYTNRFKQPEPGKPPAAADPNHFYNQWYDAMRRFAQARETVEAGQVTVRSK